MRVPGLGGWGDDPLWASVYDWSVEHPRPGGLLWRFGIGSDLRRLYAATDELGTLPAGSRVLDVPCGGGVALRGVRPGQGLDYVAADIAQAMLDRTLDAARSRGVADQVSTRLADVGELPFADDTFDAVVSFTGLRHEPLRRGGRLAGLMGPGCTGTELLHWLNARGVPDADLEVSGAIGYFRGTKA